MKIMVMSLIVIAHIVLQVKLVKVEVVVLVGMVVMIVTPVVGMVLVVLDIEEMVQSMVMNDNLTVIYKYLMVELKQYLQVIIKDKDQ